MSGNAASAGLPDKLQPAVLSYAGSVLVTAKDGTFTTTNAGVYDSARKAFSQLDRIVGGTGKFSNTKDRFIFVMGTGNDAGFTTHVRGDLCSTP